MNARSSLNLAHSSFDFESNKTQIALNNNYRITDLRFLCSYRRNQDGPIPSLAHLLDGPGFFWEGGISNVWGRGLKPPSQRLAKSVVIVLAHCKYKSLQFRSSRLSVCRMSVPRQISLTKRDRREISSPL